MKQTLMDYISYFCMLVFATTQLYLFYKTPIAAVLEIITAWIAIYCINREFEELE